MQENKKIGDLFYKSKVPLWIYAGWGNCAADVNCIRKNPNCYIGILIPICAETIGFIEFTFCNCQVVWLSKLVQAVSGKRFCLPKMRFLKNVGPKHESFYRNYSRAFSEIFFQCQEPSGMQNWLKSFLENIPMKTHLSIYSQNTFQILQDAMGQHL